MCHKTNLKRLNTMTIAAVLINMVLCWTFTPNNVVIFNEGETGVVQSLAPFC